MEYVIEQRGDHFDQVTVDATGHEIGRGTLNILDAILGIVQHYLRRSAEYVVDNASRYQVTGDPVPLATAVEIARGAIELARQIWGSNEFARLLGGTVRDPTEIMFLIDNNLVTPAEANRAWPMIAILGNFADPSQPTALPAVRIDASRTQGPVGAPPQQPPPPPQATAGADSSAGDSNARGTASSPLSDARTGGDPLILFTGQLFYQVTDLAAAGRGMQFRWTRTYLNQTIYKGPLGYSWDHSYNLWIREESGVTQNGVTRNLVYRSTGQLREDAYTQISEVTTDDRSPLDGTTDAEFQPPPGFFDRLLKIGGRYRLEAVDGTTYLYGDQHLIDRIVDRNGNEVTFEYDAELRLIAVVDPVGKRFELSHDEMNRISALHDRVGGRRVVYTYGDNGDLEEVDLLFAPDLVAGTDYRYSGPDLPYALQHNLIEIIGPDGNTALRNEYGQEPDTWAFNRVVRQISTDGEYDYDYGLVIDEDTDPSVDPINVSGRATIVSHPNGHVVEHWFNGQGNVTRRSEQVLLEGVARVLVAAYRYNEDGLLVREQRSDGSATEYRYQREAYADAHGGDASAASPTERHGFGNLLRVTEWPRPALADPRCVVTDYTYLPPLNLMTSERGPYYAYPAGHEIGGQDIAETFYDYDERGNLREIRHGSLARPDGSTLAPERRRFEYNAHGALAELRVGSIRTRYEYFADPLRSGFMSRQVRDPDGVSATRAWDVDVLGRITEAVDELGAVTRVTWTTFDAIRSWSVFDGVSTDATLIVEYEYDRARRLIETRRTVRDGDGVPSPLGPLIARTRFDEWGRGIERTLGTTGDPALRRSTTTYAFGTAIDREQQVDGVVIRHEYDERMLEVAVTRGWGTPLAFTRRATYDAVGALASVTDALGATTRIDRDGFGRIARILDAEGNEERFEFDAANRLTRVRKYGDHPESGVRLLWADHARRHDAAGNTIEDIAYAFVPGDSAPPVEQRTQLWYDALARLERRIDAEGRVWAFAYDTLGRPAATTRPDGGRETLERSDDGRTIVHVRLEPRSDGSGIAQAFRRITRLDRRALPIEDTDELGNVSRRVFDGLGRVERSIGPTGLVTGTERDVLGQIVAQRAAGEAATLTTGFGYDPRGRLVEVVAPNGERHEYAYDALGRLSSSNEAGVHAVHTYDAEGRRVRTELDSGMVFAARYSPLGLLLEQTADLTGYRPPAGAPDYRPTAAAPVICQYTPLGMSWLLTNEHATIRQDRDSLGRLRREQIGDRAVAFAYDRLDRVTELHYPDGRVIAFDYGPGQRMTAVRELHRGDGYPGAPGIDAERSIVAITRVGERPATLSFAGGLAIDVAFDGAARPISVSGAVVGGGSGGDVFRHTFLYDARSCPRLVQTDDQRERRTHDELGRLRSWIRSSATVHADVAVLAPPVAPAGPWPSQASIDDVIAALPADAPIERLDYALDDDANRRSVVRTHAASTELTEYTAGAHDHYDRVGGVPFVYERDGRLIDDGVCRYRYDAWGRLVAIDSPDGVIQRSHDALGRTFERVTSAARRRYVHAGPHLVELRSDAGPIAQLVPWETPNGHVHLAASGGDYVPIFDPTSTIHGWIDVAEVVGTVRAGRRYDPFGNLIADTGAWPAPIGFAGYEFEPEAGVYLARARTYHAATGRFLESDPAGLVDGTNVYAFARHAPFARCDPFGFASNDSHIDYHTAIASAARESVSAAAFVGVGLIAVTLLPITLPAALVIGGAALAIAGGLAYEARSNEAMHSATPVSSSSVAWAAAEDTLGVTRFHQGLTGRNILTQTRMSTRARSNDLGGGTVAVGMLVWSTVNAVRAVQAGVTTTLERQIMARTLAAETAEQIATTQTPEAVRRIELLERAMMHIARDDARLTANPSLIASEGLLSEAELNSWVSWFRPRVSYGKALERAVNRSFAGDPLLSPHIEYLSGPNRPDWVGRGVLQGLEFDLTTPEAVAAHHARDYGENMLVFTYRGPVFP